MIYKLQKITLVLSTLLVATASSAHPIRTCIQKALVSTDTFLLNNSNLHRVMNNLPPKQGIRTRNILIVATVIGCSLWDYSQSTHLKK